MVVARLAVALAIAGSVASTASAMETVATTPTTVVAAQPATVAGMTIGVAPSTATGPDGRAAFEYGLDPGAELTDYVGLFNFGGDPVTVALYASDAFTTEGGAFDLLPAGVAPTGVGAWVAFGDNTLTIPPRTRLDVPFRLTVPPGVEPGDHSGGIVASVSGDAGDGAIGVDRRVGARVHVRVAGTLTPALAVEELDARYHSTPDPFATGTMTVTFLVRNAGNVRLAGRPTVVVDGPMGLGPRSATAEVLPELLPGSRQRVTLSVVDVRPLIRLSVAARVEPVRAGRQVELPPVAEARTVVWVVPWPLIWLLVVAAAVVLGWLVLVRRGRARRAGRLAELERAREQGRAEAVAAVTSPTITHAMEEGS